VDKKIYDQVKICRWVKIFLQQSFFSLHRCFFWNYNNR